MKNKFFQFICLLAVGALFLPGCKKEYLNPSTADEQEVVKDVNGLIALCNGLQYRHSVGRQSPMYTNVTSNGFTTLELDILNPGNVDENFLSIGNDKLAGNNAVVTNLWEQCNLVKANAELVLRNAGNIGDPATRTGIVAYGAIFKALALGTMAQYWQQIPLRVEEDAQFNSREDALREAVGALESAANDLTANPTLSATFTSKIVSGIDLANTIQALLARYYTMLGDNDKALTAANKVDLTKKSEFKYDDVNRNPIFDVALSNVNVFQPIDTTLGLSGSLKPASNDGRILFYLQSKTPTNNVFKGKGFWTANSSPIPIYLPGEILLIKAEAFARKDMLPEAVAELDKVLTKSTDLYGVNANLPAYAGANTKAAILEEIYRNRCIELFMSGLKLEDSRRFGRMASPTNLVERNRDWYPYPNNERDNNPNTPTDPVF